jgi:hypothetical protein
MGNDFSGSHFRGPFGRRPSGDGKILEPEDRKSAEGADSVRRKTERLVILIMRQFGGRTGILTVAVCIAIGTVVCAEVVKYWNDPRFRLEDPRYLVARRALVTGNAVSFLDFGLSPDVGADADALTDQDVEILKGAKMASPLAVGEVLTRRHLAIPEGRPRLGARIPKGMRAYVVHPFEPPALRTGDKVDIVLSPGSALDTPLILVEGATILDAGFRGEQFEAVLAVTAEEIQVVEKGKQRGKLKLALRHPDDIPRRLTRERVRRARRIKSNSVEILTDQDPEGK